MNKKINFLTVSILAILVVFFLRCNSSNQPSYNIMTNMSGKGSPEQIKFTGLYKNFHPDGYLYSEIFYKDGIKNGLAKKYYEDGKLQTKSYYKYGLLSDTSIWYFKSGKPYRETLYHKGRRHGLQKIFYSNGEILAIIPYSDGHRKTGLKEYDQDQELINEYPDIVFSPNDCYKSSGKFFLDIKLSNKSKDVKYFTGTLTNDVFIADSLNKVYSTDGVGKLVFFKDTGYTSNKSINIIGLYRTSMGNVKIIQKRFPVPYKDMSIITKK